MERFRRQISPRWLVTTVVIFGVNLAGVLAALNALEQREVWIPGARGPNGANTVILQRYDGSVVEYIFPHAGGRTGPFVIQPPSVTGLCSVWWPVAASIGGSLLILGVSWRRSRRRSEQSAPRPRMNMLQSMALVGFISLWLWLIRFDVSLVIVGFTVLVLMLHASYRWTVLVDETKALGMSKPTLSLAGIVCYSVAVLLASAWVLSILVWDSIQGVRP